MDGDSPTGPTACYDEDEDIHPPSNELHFHASTLQDVRLVDSSFYAFTIRNSTLATVLFRHCTFSNVTSENCFLDDVTFSGLEWSNVRVTGFVLRDVKWEGQGLRNVCITDEMRLRREDGVIRIPVRERSATKLCRSLILPPSRVGGLDEQLGTMHAATIAVVARRPTGLLQLPKAVLHRIMEHLFFKRDVVVRDREITSYPNTRQTQYCINSDHRLFYTYQGGTSYIESDGESTHTSLSSIVSIVRTHSRLYNLALSVLYSRPFTFSSPEGCLSFLHDHQRPEHSISGVGLRYGADTNPVAWRRLFDILILERKEICELRLDVGEDFWTNAPWEQGAEKVLGWRWGRGRFLQEVLRMPGVRLVMIPESRDGEAISIEDVRFFLRIEGSTESVRREGFVGKLEGLMRRIMLEQREVLIERRTGWCCAVRVLEHCCYWSGAMGGV